MEASGAGLAGGDAAGQGDAGGGVATAEAQAGQGDNGQLTGDAAIAQLAQQVSQMQGVLEGSTDTQEQLRQWVASQAQQAATQQQQQQQADERPDLSFLEQETDPQVAAERLQSVIDQAAERRAQALFEQRVGPLEQSVSEMRLQQETDQLISEFPELGKPDVAKQALSAAEDAAQLVGQPELAGNPAFVRQTYLAGRAMQLAQEQGQQGAGAPGAPATLEGAGGAGAAGQGTQDPGEQIASQWSQRGSVLPRW